MLLSQEMGTVPYVQGADALRPLELVSGEADQVGAERLQVEIDPGSRLDRVDVKHDAPAATDAIGDLGDRLDRPDLVVGKHDADEDRPVGQRGIDFVGIDPPIAVDRQLDDLEPELLEVAQAVTDSVVLDRARHDPVAARLARPGGTLQGEVVRLRPARGEYDLARLGMESASEPLVRLVEHRARPPAVGMCGGRVPERLPEVGQHRRDDLRPDRCRGRVVEIDRHRPDCTSGPGRDLGEDLAVSGRRPGGQTA